MKLGDTIEALLRLKSNSRVVSIEPSQSVYEAIELMAKESVGALMVLSENRLRGILSERDYARKVILKGRSSKETPVHEIMTTPVVFVTLQNTVDDCMAIMTKHHFRHLPVVEGERVIAVVSIGDLVNWIISGQAHTIQELEGYITGRYPG
jgi:CBS domain-containing protein